MKKILKKTYQWYLLYGVLLTSFLLYFCFPSDALKDYFINTVGSVNPHLLVSVEDARPSLALGVTFLNARFSPKTNPDILLFKAEKITIRPNLGFIWGKGYTYSFNCQGYGGKIEGKICFKENIRAYPVDVMVNLKNIHLETSDYVAELIGHDSKGVVSGIITLKGQPNSLLNGTGKAEFTILNGRVPLREPLFNLESVDFDELQVKLVLKNRQMAISQLKLTGQEIQGKLSGTIRLNRDLVKSRLDLDGTLAFQKTLFSRDTGSFESESAEKPLMLPFTIYGTIEDPEYRIS